MNIRITSIFLAATLASTPVVRAAELLVPAYFYPQFNRKADYWGQLATSAPKAAITAILNPDNGPGIAADANYLAAISRVQTAGGKAIGYVSTNYANRPMGEVVADINTYVALYPVQGFFIDEMTTDTGSNHISFY